jgi:hypothetical protein
MPSWLVKDWCVWASQQATYASVILTQQHRNAQSGRNRAFGIGIPEHERTRYGDEIRDNRPVLSVRVTDDAMYQRAMQTMEACNPVDIGEHDAADIGEHDAGGAETEQVIPVVKEELAVGKRVTEQRHRIRSYIIERPVEETVMLHDEHVEIERRPATGRGATPQERDVEVIEHHEEPVAEKRGRVEEEVVVRKKVSDRPQTVRATVGETKVDVDREPATPTRKPSR